MNYCCVLKRSVTLCAMFGVAMMHADTEVRRYGLREHVIIKNNPTITIDINTTSKATTMTHTVQTVPAPIASMPAPTASTPVVYDTIGAYRWWIALGVSVVAYVALLADVHYAAYYCTRRTTWATWHNELSLAQLRSVPSEECATQLFNAINTTYGHTGESGDFLYPIVQFVNALEYERAWHDYFLSLHERFERYHVHAVLPAQVHARSQITEQRERLIYLKQLLLQWISTYHYDDHAKGIRCIS